MSDPVAPYLSMVIPAYNEAQRLPGSLGEIAAFCRESDMSCEVIVIVEKSSDKTLELAAAVPSSQANFYVIDNHVRRGKGYAVRSGMLKARGEFVFYMDADLSVPLDEIKKFLDFFTQNPGVDVLAGNRKHPQSDIVKRQSWLRQKMGEVFNLILRRLIRIRVLDTQCGFKAFRARSVEPVFSSLQTDGFAFDVEVLLLAEKLGFKVRDLPVRWRNSSRSKVRMIRDSLIMIRDVFHIRRKMRRMKS